MKKINLTSTSFKGEVLTKSQLKKVMGGVGSTNCAEAYSSVEPDCYEQFPYDAPQSNNPSTAIQYAQCVSSGFQNLLDNGCDKP